MRKIDELMAQAFTRCEDFKLNNTEVRISKPEYLPTAYLHGNRIAYTDEQFNRHIDVDTLRQYPTSTTLSRLRALGFNVCRKNGKVLINGEPI